MRVSFSTGTFYQRSLRYSLTLARDLGYDGVELVLGPGYLLRGAQPLRDAVASVGAPVLSVHPPFYPLPGWPRQSSEAIPRLAQVTRDVDAELFVVHLPDFVSLTSPRAQRFTSSLRAGVERGAGAARIGLETTQYNKRTRRYALDDLEQLARFAGERDCGVTFDTCHAGANGQDILACYEALRPVLCNVHLSDVVWRGGKPVTHRLPGEGELPLDALLRSLARDRYEGLVTLEIHPLEAAVLSTKRARRRLKKALDFVRLHSAPPGGERQ